MQQQIHRLNRNSHFPVQQYRFYLQHILFCIIAILAVLFPFLSSGFEIFFEKSPKRIAVRKVNQATAASCKTIASFAIRAFTSSSCVCFAFSAGIALTTKIVPPILSKDGEGLSNGACNVFHFRTSVIQVLKKLKSRDSNGRDYLSQSFASGSAPAPVKTAGIFL